MKKNIMIKIFSIFCAISLLSGCSIDNLKTKKYIEVPGNAYSQIEKKDTTFNEVVENGEIEVEDNENVMTQQEELSFTINGPLNDVNFKIPINWYESTNGKKKELTATKNPDSDLNSSWINKSFCDESGLYRMFIYVVPSEDFGENLLSSLTFKQESDKKLRKIMGAYPNVGDIQYGSKTIENSTIDYAWKTYSGTTKGKANIDIDVSYTRGVCLLDSQTIIFSLYLTSYANEIDSNQLVENFYYSIIDNN